MFWKFRGQEIDLTTRGMVVGIVNVTPDSFSDGGIAFDPEAAVRHGTKLLSEGANLLDVGGESTRPGALPVTAEEELRRVVPTVKALRKATNAPISVDTSKASVAEAALAAGADIINDVTALSDPAMGEVVSAGRAGLILMHMQGTPATMQRAPSYEEGDVTTAVAKFLSERLAAALACGVPLEALILDPGLGFGKTAAHNTELLRGLPDLCSLGAPVMIGHSRKSFLGKLAAEKVTPDFQARLHPAVAITALARQLGARLFRVHDPAPHRAALRAAEALLHADHEECGEVAA